MPAERIIEIATDGRHLAVSRGFMTVSEDGNEIARIPLDDIAAVIGCAHGLTYSNNLLVELAQRKALLVICGSNFSPAAFLWAVDGHHQQSARMELQLTASAPKSKQVWKQIVQAKIAQQAAVAAALGENSLPVSALVAKVRSGDPENIEAQAARRYWPLVFGDSFRREQSAGGVNAMLNYGYMIIRSAMARSIMAAGLHPSIGVHHSNMYNPMRLVDDMMEPFRPFVDFAVWHLLREGQESVTPDVKARLVSLLDMEVETETGMTALRTAIQTMAVSLAMVFEGAYQQLQIPRPQLPLWQSQL
jgi:CRISPR-associated protein Cas1